LDPINIFDIIFCCFVSEIARTSNVALGHVGGRLLLRYYGLYRRLQLQFYVLLMMGATDTQNM
jgi:hypothetical protein